MISISLVYNVRIIRMISYLWKTFEISETFHIFSSNVIQFSFQSSDEFSANSRINVWMRITFLLIHWMQSLIRVRNRIQELFRDFMICLNLMKLMPKTVFINFYGHRFGSVRLGSERSHWTSDRPIDPIGGPLNYWYSN